VNLEKTGVYKFNSNVRKVTYFNNLFNFANPVGFANSEHASNVRHTFGDFDFTWKPQSETLRITAGMSFNDTGGTGGTTERFFSDEYAVKSRINNDSIDYRIGAEGKLIGFDWGLSQGIRKFRERTFNFLDAPSQGNTTTNQSRLDTFDRSYPTDGHASYTQFNLHRLFARRLDFTGRFIYTSTKSSSTTILNMTGRDNTNPVGNIVRSDRIDAAAFAKRPQTRADVGLTYAATDKFRISNTFSFDQFAVNGFETFQEVVIKATGNPLVTTTRSTGYHVNAYKRYANTIEGDYQFNPAVAFHLGYRYTHRQVENSGYNLTLTSAINNSLFNCTPRGVTNQNPLVACDDEKNRTNTLLAGMKIKPMHNWVVFWDIEHGQADNVFTRPENYKFTNFRVRSRLTVDKFTFNLSAITKDNENPSSSETVIFPAGLDYVTNIKNRFYSGSVDWEPNSRFYLSSGYTYRHLTSYTPVVLPVSGAVGPPAGYVFGFSQYFMRDHYVFFDISAKPVDRVSFYASYRLDLDKGQGNRVSPPIGTTVANFITSYPMHFTTPEFRVAFRITDNVDWNIGYQYYNYRDTQTPFENYKAHLPYTSIRIYFGGRAVDR
jgi:hypothetical protein